MYLTIAIAVYNGEKYLSRMVDSILAQSFRDYELLLLDDGSSDGSGALCDAYAARDERVRVVHKENAGLCASRNMAVSIARGSYICFPDQDDRMMPGTLEAFVRSLQGRAADFALCGYNVRVENAAGKVIEQRSVCTQDALLEGGAQVEQFYLQHLADGVAAPVWNICYSLDFLRQRQLRFDESLRMSLDDLAFHTHAFFAAERVNILSIPGIEYYVRMEASSSRRYNPQFSEQCLTVLSRLREQIDAAGTASPAQLKQFYIMVFRLYVISGLQNVIGARKTLGKKTVIQDIRQVSAEAITEETIGALASGEALSRYERIILNGIQKKRFHRVYRLMVCKDWVRGSHLRTVAKRLVS